jgi:acetyl esterase/lipase
MNTSNRKSPILVVAALLAMIVCVRAADRAPRNAAAKGSRSEADRTKTAREPRPEPDKVVVFKQTPQGELKVHIYFPPGWSAGDKRVAMVLWSGGGFQLGTAGQFFHQAKHFSSRGLVAICAEYRGRSRHKILIDSCVEDARSAMRWVKGRAAELGIDPTKVIASGGSAGGTLSLLVARNAGPDAKDDDLKVSTRPCALVLYNPAIGESVLERIGQGGPAQAPVNAQIVALNVPRKDEPPVIMFYGTEDRPFLDRAGEFNRQALAQGSRCELWTADKMAHSFFNNQPWRSATARKADEFLVSLGYLKGPPTIPENPAAPLVLVGKE